MVVGRPARKQWRGCGVLTLCLCVFLLSEADLLGSESLETEDVPVEACERRHELFLLRLRTRDPGFRDMLRNVLVFPNVRKLTEFQASASKRREARPANAGTNSSCCDCAFRTWDFKHTHTHPQTHIHTHTHDPRVRLPLPSDENILKGFNYFYLEAKPRIWP